MTTAQSQHHSMIFTTSTITQISSNILTRSSSCARAPPRLHHQSGDQAGQGTRVSLACSHRKPLKAAGQGAMMSLHMNGLHSHTTLCLSQHLETQGPQGALLGHLPHTQPTTLYLSGKTPGSQRVVPGHLSQTHHHHNVHITKPPRP